MRTSERWMEQTSDAAGRYGGALRETLDRARGRLSDVASIAQDKRDAAMRATENYVAGAPYMTIAIAAAVGLAVGMILMSGARSRDDDY